MLKIATVQCGETCFLRSILMSLWITWGGYVTFSNCSRYRATIGQKMMRIYVCTIFGGTVPWGVALGRFVIFSAPLFFLLSAGGQDLVPRMLLNDFTEITFASESPLRDELFYTLLMIPLVIQFIFLWSFMTGNYGRVLWDRLFHACVLQRNIRTPPNNKA